jgi:DNA-binding response OmpR family regulator
MSSAPSVSWGLGEKEVCRVLIVEDDADFAKLLAVTLTSHAHEMQSTRNATEALTVASTYRPHVALIDIGLPGHDGHYVARELRKSGRNMLMIAVTGRSSHEDVERSRHAGCDHHLVKPVDIERMLNVLSDWRSRTAGW